MRLLLICLFLIASCSQLEPGQKYKRTSHACAIDMPRPNLSFKANSPIPFSGWMYDENDESFVPEHLVLSVFSADKQLIYQADAPRNSRADVAKAFHKPTLEMSGFTHTIPANLLKPGEYEVIITEDSENFLVECYLKPFRINVID